MDNKQSDIILYSCECKMDGYEYGKMIKYFPGNMYLILVRYGLIYSLVLAGIIAIVFKSFMGSLLFFIIFLLYKMILYRIRISHYAEKIFNNSIKKNNLDTYFTYEFYDDKFIIKNKNIKYEFKYSDITTFIETDTNFYYKKD